MLTIAIHGRREQPSDFELATSLQNLEIDVKNNLKDGSET